MSSTALDQSHLEPTTHVDPVRCPCRALGVVRRRRWRTCRRWCPSGNCWRTCRSPICCSGCRRTGRSWSAPRRPGRPPASPPSSTTGSSAVIAFADFPLLRHAWEEERVMSEEPPVDAPRSFIRRQVIPVRYLDEVVAVIERDTSSMVGREGSLLETAYVDAADDLFQMVSDGTFPPHDHPGEMHTGPRAGDGLLRLDADGNVVYVSPNALSAYHRLAYNGEVIGQRLSAADPAADRRSVRRRGTGRADRRGGAGQGRACGWRSRPRPPRCCSGRCRCGRTAGRRARWCWSGTSPRCAGGTGRCCRRTPPSGRSTTG